MRRAAVLVAGAAAVSAAALVAIVQGEEATGVTFMGEAVTAAEISIGQEVYAQACTSCHGADLEGQPDWRRRLESGRMPAPPHDETGHTWHHADGQLFTITKHGVEAVVSGYESDMPAFEGILTDAEIRAALSYIKSTWPERERSFQAEVTANDEGSQ